MAKKPEPEAPAVPHKVQRGTLYVCACGWKSGIHTGEGSKERALAEWHAHRDKTRGK